MRQWRLILSLFIQDLTVSKHNSLEDSPIDDWDDLPFGLFGPTKKRQCQIDQITYKIRYIDETIQLVLQKLVRKKV